MICFSKEKEVVIAIKEPENDTQEIKEALKSLLTKQWQSKYLTNPRKKKLIAQDNISKVITTSR